MRINEVAFLRKKESDVPVDQVFFHRFFRKKNEREQVKATKAAKRKQDDEDGSLEGNDDDEGEEDDEGSDLDEQEVWKAMKATIPRVPEDDALSEESDELPSNFDMSEEEDEDGEAEIFELAEGSDNDDLLSLDADVPGGLIEYDGDDTEDVEWGGIEREETGEKRKRRGLRTDQRTTFDPRSLLF